MLPEWLQDTMSWADIQVTSLQNSMRDASMDFKGNTYPIPSSIYLSHNNEGFLCTTPKQFSHVLIVLCVTGNTLPQNSLFCSKLRMSRGQRFSYPTVTQPLILKGDSDQNIFPYLLMSASRYFVFPPYGMGIFFGGIPAFSVTSAKRYN